MENTTKKKKPLIILASLLGCSSIILCCILVFVLLVSGYAIYGQQSPEGVVIDLELPSEVQLGEEFNILLRIENIGVEPQNLIAISFLMDYLVGVDIIDSDPTFIYQDEIIILEIPMQIFTYREMILEGEILEVNLVAVPVQVGDFAGEFQVCLNGPTNCERIQISTTVTD